MIVIYCYIEIMKFGDFNLRMMIFFFFFVEDYGDFFIDFYGKDGMGDVKDIFNLDMLLLKIEYVVNVLIRIVNEYFGEIILVFLGLLINIVFVC